MVPKHFLFSPCVNTFTAFTLRLHWTLFPTRTLLQNCCFFHQENRITNHLWLSVPPPTPHHWCCLSGKWKKNKSWLTGLRHVKSWVWTEVRVVSDRYWSSVSSPPVSPTSIVSDGEVASVHLLGGKTEEELVSWWRLIRINGADRLDRLLETNTSINVTSGERAPTSRDTTHCWDVKSGHRQRPLSLKNSTVK